MQPSRIIFASCRTLPTEDLIESGDMPPKLTLQSYLTQVLKDEGLSLGDVSRNSKSGGGTGISKDYVSDLMLGEHDNPTPDKIVALATGIRRPLLELLEVIFGKFWKDEGTYRDTTLRSVVAEFNDLPSHEQKEFKPAMDMLFSMVLREIRRRKSTR